MNLSYISICFPGVPDRPVCIVCETRISVRSSRRAADCRPWPVRFRALATGCRCPPRGRCVCRPRRRVAGNAVPLTDPPWSQQLVGHVTTSAIVKSKFFGVKTKNVKIGGKKYEFQTNKWTKNFDDSVPDDETCGLRIANTLCTPRPAAIELDAHRRRHLLTHWSLKPVQKPRPGNAQYIRALAPAGGDMPIRVLSSSTDSSAARRRSLSRKKEKRKKKNKNEKKNKTKGKKNGNRFCGGMLLSRIRLNTFNFYIHSALL